MPDDPRIGTMLGGYRIEAQIGRGGMGIVYRAEQVRLGRKVALKVITPELASDPSFRERFERESRMAASLDHPHVVPVHEANEEDGLLYITMRYVAGTDLRALITQRGRLEPASVVTIVSQVSSALDAAHGRGLVHRDVKPANVLIAGEDGSQHAYLTDFGLTKHAVSRGGLTRTGEWVGTLDYVAPEQIEGGAIDARTDVYALGCVLYETLSGEVPFPAETDVAKMWAHVNRAPPSLAAGAPELAPRFDAVVARALAKRPEDRYPSAGDLGRAALAAERAEHVAEPERSVARGDAAPTAAGIIAPASAGVTAAATGTAAAPTEPLAPAPAPAQRVPADAQPTRAIPDAGRRGRVLAFAVAIVGIAAVAALATVLIAGRSDEDGPSTSPSGDTPPPADAAFEPFSPSDPNFRGYQTEIPSGWGLTEEVTSSGQIHETTLQGPSGLSLRIDYTPFEPPGAPQEGGGLDLQSSAQEIPVGDNVANKYVFTGTSCPATRCVDYQVFLPSGGGVAVLGSAQDLTDIEPIAQRVTSEVREIGGP